MFKKTLNSNEDYNLTGNAAILEAIETTLGHAFVDEKYRADLQSTDVGKTVLSVLNCRSQLFASRDNLTGRRITYRVDDISMISINAVKCIRIVRVLRNGS